MGEKAIKRKAITKVLSCLGCDLAINRREAISVDMKLYWQFLLFLPFMESKKKEGNRGDGKWEEKRSEKEVEAKI
ncbi:MAG: hypothetical protein N2V78_07440 [Methanophagales archaeon]|nr:hypothetical protein [Methanophagales archaeon]